MALDEDKLEALRRWGHGLRQAGGEERAAAGRAILMLIEEVDRLRLELSQSPMPSLPAPTSSDAAAEREEPGSTLQERVQLLLGRDSASGAQVDPTEEDAAHTGDATTTSPQSWIEALRRQK
jgi:hypothetical protein